MPPVTRAFVLGAGLGKRLRPLTERRPKPLVPLYHKPLITFAFDHLISCGIESFAVNTHHCPEAYHVHLGENGGKALYRGRPVSFRHEPVLLDTGGGIKNVENLIGNHPFVVYNGDVLADFPLAPLIESHLAGGNIATLALRSHGGPLHIQCDTKSGLISDIRGTLGRQADPSFLFTGISVLSPEIFQHIPGGEIISIIPVYLEILKQRGKIGGVVVDGGLWFDLGTRESYLDAHRLLAPGGYQLSHAEPGWPSPVHGSSTVHPAASLEGICAVGPGAVVGAGAKVKDSVLWENSTVESSAEIDRCIVRDGSCATGQIYSTDL